MIAPLLLCLIPGRSEIKLLDDRWSSGLHEIDGGSWAIEAGEIVSIMDAHGRETGTIRIPDRSAFLGFNGRSEPLFGPAYSPEVRAGDKADRMPSLWPNAWTLMFERGTYLAYTAGTVHVQTADRSLPITGLRWRDPVCVGRDEKALYVLRTDLGRTRLDRFVLDGRRPGARHSLEVRTRGGKPLQTLVGWSMSITPLDKHTLITFCEPTPFTPAERGAAPLGIGGKPNKTEPHHEAICAIDTRTGVATLLFRLLHFFPDPTEHELLPTDMGVTIEPGMERRRDIAVLPGTDTFVARWGWNLFFCRIGKGVIPDREVLVGRS